MCNLLKIVFINSILLIVVLAKQKEDAARNYEPKCHTNLLIDITNGTRNETTNHILHENVTYTKNDYHLNASNPFQILGCICNIEKHCVRKCCPIGFAYNRVNHSCIESDSILTRNFEFPVFDKEKEINISAPKHFKFVFGKTCSHGAYELLPDDFKDDLYFLQHNGSLYFPHNEVTYKNAENYCLDVNMAENQSIIALACFPPPSPEPGIVYSIGMIISMPFLMVTFFVYACVPELQNIHGKCLMCYVSTLLIAYIFLVSVQLNNNTENVFCVVAPFIIYFAFMVSFMWLNVMCIDIWWTFSGRKGFRDSGSNSERTRFSVYSIYAWGIPLIMLCVAIGLQFAKDLPSYVVSPKFGQEKCWFPDDKSMGYYFYGPILIIILANLTLFAYTSIQIYKVQRDVDQSMRHESQRHGSDTEMKQRYKLYLKLMLVFGVNWLMEIVSWLVSGPQWLWYVTDMCNALYGVFIFFIFVCKANVWKLCRKRYHVFMGRPYLANTYAPTSSTRSTGVSQTTAHTPGNGIEADSYGLTSSTAA